MKIENFNFAGHKAIVRVDFNVPLDENGNVTTSEIGRAVQQECRDRSRMPSSA